MDWKAEAISFLKEYVPAFLVLIISWRRDQILKAKHDAAIKELERKHWENRNYVDDKFNGMSSDDIIRKYSQGAD